MITTKDIVAAVNRTLKKGAEGVSVRSADFDKKVKRPSLYVEYPTPTFDGNEYLLRETGTIRINYFPENEDPREELADMQLKLSGIFFGILRVTEEFVIPINELSFEISDDVLIASFDYETHQYREETGEDLTELEADFSEMDENLMEAPDLNFGE